MSVEEAGGQISGVLDRDTSVLVCVRPAGEKWRSAVSWGIPCVTTAWLLDSLDRGQIMETSDYRLEEREEPQLPPPPPPPACKVIQSEAVRAPPGPTKAATKLSLDSLGLTEVKKAGTFLDGCTVFLAVGEAHLPHLAKVLKHAGAVRLGQLTERVTHVVVENTGQRDNINKQLEQLDITPAVVEVGWITDSMKAGAPALVQPIQPPQAEADVSTGKQEYSWDTINTFNTFNSADQSTFEEDLLAYYR